MVAVDDLQWLDRPLASVLEFCFRSLQREPVSILLTFRKGGTVFPLSLNRAPPPDRFARVGLGPLSLGAIGKILRSQVGAALPQYIHTRLNEAGGGNPFYALESDHALLDHPRTPRINGPIPNPQNLSDLVRHRVRQLTPDARRVGRFVAASADAWERRIRAAYGDQESLAAIDQAICAVLLEPGGEMLRFTHPLLRSVLYVEMTPSERREVHHVEAWNVAKPK